MKLRIITWNINSIRIRLHNIQALVKALNPDVLCLQETKVTDDLFPLDAARELGFPFIEIHGQPGYNGVAVLSKLPLEPICRLNIIKDKDRRHIAVKIADIELHNFYVPAGGDIPDPEQNPSFGYKLDFVDWMHDWFQAERTANTRMVLVGDLNIAPQEHDVWSHKQLLKIISHTPVEVEKLTRLQSNLNWCDVARRAVPAQEKLYSWWSYRNQDWRKSDRGRRLDHIWVTQPLTTAVTDFHILKDARDWQGPSDHVPVMTELEI